MEDFGDLPLCHGLLSPQTVSHRNDLPLSGVKDGSDETKGAVGGDLPLNFGGKTFVTADDVDIGQGIPVPIHVDGLIERDLGG